MQSDELFYHASLDSMPLPGRLRPHRWEQFVGHEHLVRMLKNKPLHSMILYGPPGCGKTTLARILTEHSGVGFHSLSAVSAGIKEVREVIQEGQREASLGRRHALFIDEIHRFNKAQQDALLEAVESGWVILIGATTENPSFEVIGPLLSRCQVYRLRALEEKSLAAILDRAFQEDPALAGFELEEEARRKLLEASGGDARKMLRVLEVALQGAPLSSETERSSLTVEDMERVLQHALRRYDKTGENHYDFISAFIKSLRGSDPDAALLYMACMIEAGEDPLFIARRMVIFASEDVGNAYPRALSSAVDAFRALERIGMPEGRIILAQTAVLLASVPKSNAAYLAIDRALELVRGRQVTIPNHLRNAPTKTHRDEGAGKGYRYPHDHPDHFVVENYMPPGFEGVQLYRPTSQGQEETLRQRLRRLWEKREYGE